MKRRGLGFVFGHYMPQYLALEESLVSQPLRLPGLHSEKIQLEIVTGRDTDFGFEDYLCGMYLNNFFYLLYRYVKLQGRNINIYYFFNKRPKIIRRSCRYSCRNGNKNIWIQTLNKKINSPV